MALDKLLFLTLLTFAQARPDSVGFSLWEPHDDCPATQYHYLLPHEYDCTKFYYCEYGMKYIEPRICAPGTEFSYELQVCIMPSLANCTLPGVPPTDPEPTDPPYTTTELPTSTTTESTTTTTTPTTTTTTESTTTTTTPTTTTTTPTTTTTESTTTTTTPTTTTTTPTTTTTESTTTTTTPTTTTTTPTTTTTESTTTTTTPTTTTTTPTTTTTESTTTTTTPTTTTTTPTTTTTESTTTTTTPTTTTTTPTTTTTTTPTTTTTTTPTTTTTTTPTTTTTTTPTTTTTTTPTTTTTTTPITTTTTTPITTTTTTTSTTTQASITEDDCEFFDNGCPTDFDVHKLLPHETNCSRFYYCVFGEKVERECAPGTHFNYDKQVCDWPHNVNCTNSGDGNGDGDGGNGDGGNGDGGNGGGDEDCDEFLPNGCPADFNVHYLLPHENDCEKFYECVHGNLVERLCAPGTHFNAALQVCDWPQNAGCETGGGCTGCPGGGDGDNGGDGGDGENGGGDGGSGDGDPEVLPNGCPSDFDVHQLLPHESNCSRFYQCVFGEIVERECAPGTHFNAAMQICDWPANAGCETIGGGCSGSDGDGNESTCPESGEDGDNDGGDGDGNGEDGDDGNEDGDNDGCVGCPGGGDGDSGGDGNGEDGDDGNEDGDNGGCVGCPGGGELLPNGCPSNFSVELLLPHEDCGKFYQCVHGDIIEMNCAEGTHFNPVAQICDWPANAGCEAPGSGVNPDGENPDAENPDAETPGGENPDAENPDAENPDAETPDGENPDGETPDVENPDTEENPGNSDKCITDCNVRPWADVDCDKYWRCEGQKAVLVTCSEGLLFNDVTGTCDFACNTDCVRSTIELTEYAHGIRLYVPWDKVDSSMLKLISKDH